MLLGAVMGESIRQGNSVMEALAPRGSLQWPPVIQVAVPIIVETGLRIVGNSVTMEIEFQGMVALPPATMSRNVRTGGSIPGNNAMELPGLGEFPPARVATGAAVPIGAGMGW